MAGAYFRSHGFPHLKGTPTWNESIKKWMFPEQKIETAPGKGGGQLAGGGAGGGRSADGGGAKSSEKAPSGAKPSDGSAGGAKSGGGAGGVDQSDADRAAARQREADDQKLAEMGTSREQIRDKVNMTNGAFMEKYGLGGWWKYPATAVRDLPPAMLRRILSESEQDNTLYLQPSGRISTNAVETANKVAEYQPPDSALGGVVRGTALLAGASAEDAERLGRLADGVSVLVELGMAYAARKVRAGQAEGGSGGPGGRGVGDDFNASPRSDGTGSAGKDSGPRARVERDFRADFVNYRVAGARQDFERIDSETPQRYQVYEIRDAQGGSVYVGIVGGRTAPRDAVDRLQEHLQTKPGEFIGTAATIHVLGTNLDERLARALEYDLIKEKAPAWNSPQDPMSYERKYGDKPEPAEVRAANNTHLNFTITITR
ncbi:MULTISPECIES: GIY-YIG nuclease family protein [Pseudofrankia]|uniref:GIY-YIG nuclease family protein n=1 Tax=Pseudofrankia TaxID=2994363 RepID=UPI0002DD01AE|nr:MULTISPECIES: GIY-YIG nuclease family protein [Pseudofrankia]